MAQTKEQKKVSNKKYNDKNKDYYKNWRDKHKEELTAYNKAKYLENKDKVQLKLKTDRAKQKDKGLCTFGVCKKSPTGNQQLCERHWFGQSANQAQKSIKGSKVKWQEIQKLYEKQNKLCAVSGMPIVPGDNMQLDHIIPRNLGGTNDLNNLRWVWSVMNRIKWHNNDYQFMTDIYKLKELLDSKPFNFVLCE